MNTLAGLALLLSAVLGPGYVPQVDALVVIQDFPQKSAKGVTLAYIPFGEPKVVVIHPDVFHDPGLLRHVLAHEEGHILRGWSEKDAEAYACKVEPTYCGYLLTD